MTKTLEQRIGDALADNANITAADIANLVVQTQAAIEAADQAAIAARDQALNSALPPNEARQRMDDASFTAGRLRTRLPKLQQRYLEVDEREQVARWEANAARVERLRDAAASKFLKTRDLIDELAAIFAEVADVEKEVNQINTSSPSGGRHLHAAELVARNLASFSQSDPSIIATTTLRGWNGKEVWPLRRGLDVSSIVPTMAIDSRYYSGDWHEARADNAAAVAKEQRRALDHHDRQAQEREDRANAAERDRAAAMRRTA